MCNFQILLKNNEKQADYVKKIYKKKKKNHSTLRLKKKFASSHPGVSNVS